MKMVRFFRSKKSPKTRPKYRVKFDPGPDITKMKKKKIDYDIRELQREMNWFESVKKKDPSYNYSKKYYKHYKEMMQEMGKLKSQRKNLE